MNCPDCKTKMNLEMERDSTGKRYYEICPNCKKKIEVSKLGAKKKRTV